MIDAVCVECGSYLDRDETTCRACGADNTTAGGDDSVVELDDVVLDRLGEWSLVKHEIISKYASTYTTILSKQRFARRIVYIDGFAGAGVAIDGETGEYVPGSAVRALEIQPEFDEYHFIELDDRKRSLLRRLTENNPRVTVHRGDCHRVLVEDVLPRCLYEDYSRGLCLLDPYGLTVDYGLLQRIGAMKSVEIFFNFMVVSANRNVLWTDPARVSRSRWPLLTKAWGDESWRTDLYERQADLLGGRERKISNERVVEKYRDRLRMAGFKYVPKPIPMRNSHNATVYYLFFASPNRTGAEIVDDIFRTYS
jgi:three-Cys-motif partner protein